MPANTLLLQGPVGPFFRRLAAEFSSHGHSVWRINFNAGDRHFHSGPGVRDYKGTIDGWGGYLGQTIDELSIERIYVFGDCRIYHEIAREVAKRKGVRFFVFEEGYVRPDYITLEENGVNGHSEISLPQGDSIVSLRTDAPPRYVFSKAFPLGAWYSVRYYMAASWGAHEFPFYRHHRPLNVLGEGGKWLLSAWRKLKNLRKSRRFETYVATELSQRYFLIPLQVHVDMQVVRHSRYSSVEAFITGVVDSFAQGADQNTALVFKHHPFDRGYRDYTSLITRLARKHGIESRVQYIFDSHLPTLLKHALGTVTINSTVGLSSLHHGIPVKVMGEAVYDHPGLTFSDPLDEFWKNPGKVNRELYQSFRTHLLDSNQLNGNFYQRNRFAPNATGLFWSPYLLQQHFASQVSPAFSGPAPRLRLFNDSAA